LTGRRRAPDNAPEPCPGTDHRPARVSSRPEVTGAAITPRPAINLVLYQGALAPHARWRSQVVRYAARPLTRTRARPRPAPARQYPGPVDLGRPDAPRVDLDVLACPRCGGRLHVIAAVQDPLAVQAVLAHLARSGAPASPGPAPPAPAART